MGAQCQRHTNDHLPQTSYEKTSPRIKSGVGNPCTHSLNNRPDRLVQDKKQQISSRGPFICFILRLLLFKELTHFSIPPLGLSQVRRQSRKGPDGQYGRLSGKGLGSVGKKMLPEGLLLLLGCQGHQCGLHLSCLCWRQQTVLNEGQRGRLRQAAEVLGCFDGEVPSQLTQGNIKSLTFLYPKAGLPGPQNYSDPHES